VIVPIAVGAGALLAQLAQRSRAGEVAAAILCVMGGVLGLRVALDVALGRIP
jgi:hypothetical protein